MHTKKIWVCILLLFSVLSCIIAVERFSRIKKLRLQKKSLTPLHQLISTPKSGDWFDRHEEPGQTFKQYIHSVPLLSGKKRKTIYIQPIGDFTLVQQTIIKKTAVFMEAYFGLPVKIKDTLSLSIIPDTARRKNLTWGTEQILSTYVLSPTLSDAVIPELNEFSMV